MKGVTLGGIQETVTVIISWGRLWGMERIREVRLKAKNWCLKYQDKQAEVYSLGIEVPLRQ